MTEYALAPARTWDAADSPYRTPRVMLEQNLLTAYRVRSNGTMRHLELYPLASTLRETAEWISDATEYDGRSVQSVARDLHVSVATVRRYLEGLELTEEIEAGEWDDLVFGTDGEPVFSTPFGEGEEAAKAEELADGVAETIEGATVNTPVAPTEQELVDLAARHGLRRPTAEERAAALAPATRTLADTVAAGTARAATQPAGADLHVCNCTAGGPGMHAPGATNCTTPPVRRSRSHG